MHSQYMWLGLRKQVLFTQNTSVCIMAPISCSVWAMWNLLVLVNSSWISTHLIKILNAICIANEKLLHFKLWKLGHILCVDKTGFSGLFTYYISCMWMEFVKPNILSHKAYCILLLQLITAYSHALLMHSAITGLSCWSAFLEQILPTLWSHNPDNGFYKGH